VINIQPTLSNGQILGFFGLTVLEFAILGLIAWLFPLAFPHKGQRPGRRPKSAAVS
jgi:hypothetical protein